MSAQARRYSVHVRTHCRVCGHGSLDAYLTLPRLPLTDDFLTHEQCGQEFLEPATIYRCMSCGVSQTLQDVDMRDYYRDYRYTTSASGFTRNFMDDLAAAAWQRFGLRSGDTVVLVSACSADKPKVGLSFFPLTVDYREYTYAAGRFPGGFIKREGRPTEKEILTSRQIDRPIRPLFPEGYSCETQIIGMVLSADPEQDPGVLAILGAAAALAISDIPFHHVLAAVRAGLVRREAELPHEERIDRKGLAEDVLHQAIVRADVGQRGFPRDASGCTPP